MYQSDRIIKMCNNYFKDRPPPKCDLPFRTDPQVENDCVTAITYSTEKLNKLELLCGASFRSLYGEIQHITTQSRPDLAHAAHRNGTFQSY